jgi:hypothetical protein
VFVVVCILYTCLEGSLTGEADKIGKKIKNFLMLVGPSTNITATCQGTDEHKANVAPGSARDYVAYVRRPGGTDERKGLKFIDSTWPTNVS